MRSTRSRENGRGERERAYWTAWKGDDVEGGEEADRPDLKYNQYRL